MVSLETFNDAELREWFGEVIAVRLALKSKGYSAEQVKALEWRVFELAREAVMARREQPADA